ncbi:type II toxin-antitoxin system PemK/MazF family toxin [Sutcliffiella horikoshii]|uniref:type II toxin-antitoxin system PemK/MazF family toxin n=1 Tax=Sutcliffiella horikoshii TaxID=79883 RepID=UPI003CF0F8B5
MVKRGDIYLANIGDKERPVIIISNDDVNSNEDEDSIVGCAVSSNVKSSHNFLKLNGLKYGLLKEIFILPNKIYSLNKAELSRKLSRLSDSDINDLNSYLLKIQGIANKENQKVSKSEEIRTFKDLSLKGPQEELERFKQKLLEKIEDDYFRSLESNEDFPDFIMIKNQGIQKVDDSIIYYRITHSEHKVTNIIPIQKSNLDFLEYNNIVDNLYSYIIAPLITEYHFNLDVNITSGVLALEDLTNEEVAKKLTLFSRAANKSTGFSHPLDRERWLDFIYSSFKTDNIIDLDYLSRWFVEIEGWSNEIANDLVINYEYSINLLTYFIENDGHE